MRTHFNSRKPVLPPVQVVFKGVVCPSRFLAVWLARNEEGTIQPQSTSLPRLHHTHHPSRHPTLKYTSRFPCSIRHLATPRPFCNPIAKQDASWSVLSLRDLKSALPCIFFGGLSSSCISLVASHLLRYTALTDRGSADSSTKANTSSLEALLRSCQLPSCRSPDYPSSFGASSRSSP
jgi:hypothetical protein